ncbi:hypothetical protein CN355_27410 [Bacillus thuringiensis]|nr:hypothetical protein CN355_27410 [Bacillus thuringiensis]
MHTFSYCSSVLYVLRKSNFKSYYSAAKEPVFHTYEETEKTLKTLTIPHFPKHIRRKPFTQKIIKIAASE